jgi:hypothetical protein
MTAKEVYACFQEVRDLGHFCPPWHSRCASLWSQGREIQEFFRLMVGANGNKAANDTGQVFEVS